MPAKHSLRRGCPVLVGQCGHILCVQISPLASPARLTYWMVTSVKPACSTMRRTSSSVQAHIEGDCDPRLSGDDPCPDGDDCPEVWGVYGIESEARATFRTTSQ